MAKNVGFIQIHRSILTKPIFQDAKLFKIYFWCLCRAGFQENTVSIQTGRGGATFETLARGQFITGRNKGSEKLEIPPSTFRNNLKKLEDLKLIKIFPKNKYSVITVVNYDKVTLTGEQKLKKVSIKRTTGGQQKDTKNNDKNKLIKRGDSRITLSKKEAVSKYGEEVVNEFIKMRKRIEKLKVVSKIQQSLKLKEFNTLYSTYTSAEIMKTILAIENHKGAQNKYNSVYLTLSNWLSRDEAVKKKPTLTKKQIAFVKKFTEKN